MDLDDLGLDVEQPLLARWREWFAPARQPFVVSESMRQELGAPTIAPHLALEIQDTFCLYGATLRQVVLLDQDEVDRLSAPLWGRLLREQVAAGRRLVPTTRSLPEDRRPVVARPGGGRRFVWWPTTLQKCGDEPVLAFVREESGRSDHRKVPLATWARTEPWLPGARRLAGTFAGSSGPNCFGTVMAAAGVAGVAGVQVLREPFEDWLAEHTAPVGHDARPATVLVWRDGVGAVQHAALTLGDGWALHKPSQGWMTARVVLPVREVIRAARQPGHRLTRRTVVR